MNIYMETEYISYEERMNALYNEYKKVCDKITDEKTKKDIMKTYPYCLLFED